MLCEYGCSQEAKYTMANGKKCCSSFYTQCPSNRKKNSKGVKKSYDDGRITSADFSEETRWKMGSSNRGKTKVTCEHLKRKGETQRKHYKEGKIIPTFLGKKHTKETKQKLREWAISYLSNEEGSIITPAKGKYETECLDILEEKCKINIDRDRTFIGYFPDGYIEGENIIIEFDEPFHDNQENIEKDIERQENLIEHLNCRFYRIKESDWLNNRNNVILSFKKFLEE